MSRIENNKFTLFKDNFSIREAIQDVCDIMQFQLDQKSLKLTINIRERVPSQIFCDQKRFKQVLFNLLGNAAKFTFKGGIDVSVDFTNNDELITDVQDSGIGMKSEDL